VDFTTLIPPVTSDCSLACKLALKFSFFSSRRRHTRSKRDWSSDVCSSDLMKKSLSDKGIHFKTDIGLDESNVKVQDGSVKISLDSEVLFDKVLVAVGRSPNIDDIGMTNTKIEL